MSSPTTSKPTRIDGRRLRSARTKQLIIEAYLTLLRESPQIPTAATIAERAGYSVRSVFERFPDLHALRVAATDYAFTQGTAQAVARDFSGDRLTRLKSHVETRSWICEQWLPLWRALNANQGDSSELKSRILLIRQAILKRIELMYEPELSTLNADRAPADPDRHREPDRLRELGAHAGVRWPVDRGGARGVGQVDRPASAANARFLTLCAGKRRKAPLRGSDHGGGRSSGG